MDEERTPMLRISGSDRGLGGIGLEPDVVCSTVHQAAVAGVCFYLHVVCHSQEDIFAVGGDVVA